jgi:hypothetical protein
MKKNMKPECSKCGGGAHPGGVVRYYSTAGEWTCWKYVPRRPKSRKGGRKG